MTRVFTADDVRIIRSTLEILRERLRREDHSREIGWGVNQLAKIHALTQAQIYAIKDTDFSSLTEEEIAAKLHLCTDDLKTTDQVRAIYNL